MMLSPRPPLSAARPGDVLTLSQRQRVSGMGANGKAVRKPPKAEPPRTLTVDLRGSPGPLSTRSPRTNPPPPWRPEAEKQTPFPNGSRNAVGLVLHEHSPSPTASRRSSRSQESVPTELPADGVSTELPVDLTPSAE